MYLCDLVDGLLQKSHRSQRIVFTHSHKFINLDCTPSEGKWELPNRGHSPNQHASIGIAVPMGYMLLPAVGGIHRDLLKVKQCFFPYLNLHCLYVRVGKVCPEWYPKIFLYKQPNPICCWCRGSSIAGMVNKLLLTKAVILTITIFTSSDDGHNQECFHQTILNSAKNI